MRKAFAKRLAAVLLALCVAAALPLASAFAAEPATYTITFSGGEYGLYQESFVKALQDDYGNNNVKTSDLKTVKLSDTETVSGYSNVMVRLTSEEELPALPTPNVQLKSSNAAYNVMGVTVATMQEAGNTDQYKANTYCTSNYTLTPTFYLASETDVHYVLRFYVNGTEIEAAPAQYGIAPAGTFASGYTMALADVPTPAEYTLNVAATVNNSNGAITQSTDGLVLTGANPDKGEYLTFTFYYDQITHVNTVTEYVDGDVVVNYNDVNLVGGAGVVGGGDGGAGDGGEEIPDEETPQAGGEDIPDESTPQAGGEDIPDESTPEAGGETAQAGVSMPMVIGGVVGLLAILLIVLVALRKRKGGQEEE